MGTKGGEREREEGAIHDEERKKERRGGGMREETLPVRDESGRVTNNLM